MTRTRHPFTGFMWLSISFIICLTIFMQSRSMINHDVSWLLHVAQRNMQGEHLFTELVELNPPLIIWLMTPVVWISEISGLALSVVFKGYVILLSFISLLLCQRVLKRMGCEVWPIIVATIAFVLLLYPDMNFGQREHLTVILTLPYLCLIASRKTETQISLGYVAVIGIAAAVGFCIKPYFLLVPLLLEIYLLATIGVRKTFHRLEPYLIGVFSAAYAGIIFLVTPEFVTTIMPLTREIYGAGYNASWAVLLFKISFVLLLILMIMLWLALKGQNRPDTQHQQFGILSVYLIAVFGMICVFLLQSRGWRSHILPAESYAIIGTVATLAIYWRTDAPRALIEKVFAATIIGVMILNAAPRAISANHTGAADVKKFSEALTNYPDVETIYIFSARLNDGFPLVTHLDLNWGSRFPSQWMAPGVHLKRSKLNNSTASLNQIEDYYRQATADDLNKFKPEIIFVDTENKLYFAQAGFDYLTDYSHNQDFANVWSHYENVGSIKGFDIYKLKNESE